MSERRLGTILGHLKANHDSETNEANSTGGQKFRYSLDAAESKGVLSREDRLFYEENGYLVVKGLVSLHNLDIYRERFRQICTKEVKARGLTIMKDVAIAKGEFMEGERAINKIQDFQVYSYHSSVHFAIKYRNLSSLIKYFLTIASYLM